MAYFNNPQDIALEELLAILGAQVVQNHRLNALVDDLRARAEERPSDEAKPVRRCHVPNCPDGSLIH